MRELGYVEGQNLTFEAIDCVGHPERYPEAMQELVNVVRSIADVQRVMIDNSMTQLTAAGNAVTAEQTQLTSAQTNLMQADLAQVATGVSLSQAQQTALEGLIAQLDSQSNSLFSKMQ